MAMRSTEQRRLAAKGWRVGTAEEFLRLSPEESAYIEIKLKLAEKLRKQRLKRRMSQSQLARLVKSSQSRVAKMEAADPTVSLDLLVRSLLVAGLNRREIISAMS
jgi:ribosome-binding protein aMBF1 (putative translation factor)